MRDSSLADPLDQGSFLIVENELEIKLNYNQKLSQQIR